MRAPTMTSFLPAGPFPLCRFAPLVVWSILMSQDVLLATALAAAESPANPGDPSVAVEDVPVITVQAGAGDPVYAPPPYQDGQAFLPGAPLQRQIGIGEAMDLPGAFGDPVAAVRNLPGVVTGPGGELFLLGSKDQESSLTINHLPVGYLFHIDGLHSVLSSEAIAQLDVSLGAFDTTSGNAIGGVIDLSPRYPGEQRAGYLKLGVIDGGAGYEGGSGPWSAAVHLRRSWLDLLIDPSSFNDPDSRDKITTFPNYEDASFFLVYRQGNHQLSIESIYARDEIGANLQENAVKDPQLTGNLAFEQRFLTNGLRWTYDRGFLTSETLVALLDQLQTINLASDLRYKARSTTSRFYHATTFRSARHEVTGGLEFDIERAPFDARFKTLRDADTVDVDFTSSQTYEIDQTIILPTTGVFIQDIFSFSPAWKVRYGLRAERTQYGAFTTQVMPRGALVHDIGPRDTVSLASGLYSMRPETFKLLEDAGNPRLTNQRAVHYAASWTHRFSELGELNAEPFFKSYRDLVVDSASENYSNAGRGQTTGVNLSAKVGGDDWYLLAGYGFQRGRRSLSAEDPEEYAFYGDTPHAFQIAGSHRFNERWSASFLARYSSGQAYTPIVGTFTFVDADGSSRLRPRYGTPYSKRFGDNFTLNLKVAYDRQLGSGYRLESAVEVLNFTNHENVTGIEYDDAYNKEREVVNNGFFPTFSLTLRF